MPPSEELQLIIKEGMKENLVKYKTILDQSMGQIIFYGPPGTGKTYIAKELAKVITGTQGEPWSTSEYRKIVQFHPSYSYEDFVQGIKPKKVGDGFTYALQPGIFQKLCEPRSRLQNTTTHAPENMAERIALILLREEENGGNTLTVREILDRLRDGHSEHEYGPLHQFTGQERWQYGVVNHRLWDLWKGGGAPKETEKQWFDHPNRSDWGMNKKYAGYDELKERFMATGEVIADESPRVLIIDEINRGNLSKIFGELIYALEYRDEQIDLQYKEFDPESEFGVLNIPSFVKIIGTMNTADRSIILFDAALRRRFSFIPLFPDYDLLAQWLDIHTVFDEVTFKDKFASDDQNLKNKILSVLALKKINSKLADDPSIGREKQIGHTYLLGLQDNPGKFVKVWKQDILPLLEEYYFERPNVITEMFNDEIFEKEDGIKNFDDDVLSKALGNYTELIPPEPEAEPEPE